MRVFGVDPGSLRTGYGCIETDGSRHRLVACGAIATPAAAAFPGQAARDLPGPQPAAPHAPARLRGGGERVPRDERPERAEAGARARRGAARRRWRAATRSSSTRRPRSSAPSSATAAPRSTRWARWCGCCSGLTEVPQPHDAADALAVAICHVHSASGPVAGRCGGGPESARRGRRPGASTDHDCVAARPAGREAAEPDHRRRRRRRLRRGRAAVHVLHARRSRHRRGAARPHPRARRHRSRSTGSRRRSSCRSSSG